TYSGGYPSGDIVRWQRDHRLNHAPRTLGRPPPGTFQGWPTDRSGFVFVGDSDYVFMKRRLRQAGSPPVATTRWEHWRSIQAWTLRAAEAERKRDYRGRPVSPRSRTKGRGFGRGGHCERFHRRDDRRDDPRWSW